MRSGTKNQNRVHFLKYSAKSNYLNFSSFMDAELKISFYKIFSALMVIVKNSKKTQEL